MWERMFKNISGSLDGVAIVLIIIYQKYLSPYKGYRCAYSVLHGANSCSSSVINHIKDYGLIRGWRNIKGQFYLCSLASKKLHSEKGKEKNKESKCCKPVDFCAGCSPINPALKLLVEKIIKF